MKNTGASKTAGTMANIGGKPSKPMSRQEAEQRKTQAATITNIGDRGPLKPGYNPGYNPGYAKMPQRGTATVEAPQDYRENPEEFARTPGRKKPALPPEATPERFERSDNASQVRSESIKQSPEKDSGHSPMHFANPAVKRSGTPTSTRRSVTPGSSHPSSKINTPVAQPPMRFTSTSPHQK